MTVEEKKFRHSKKKTRSLLKARRFDAFGEIRLISNESETLSFLVTKFVRSIRIFFRRNVERSEKRERAKNVNYYNAIWLRGKMNDKQTVFIVYSQ